MESEDLTNIFTIMPMSQRFSLVPGETYQGSITIVNPVDAKTDFRYRASVTPFNMGSSSRENPDSAIDLATITNQSEIVKWITIEEPTGVVAPNGTSKINFTITVPKDAAGGGQYATISVGSDNELPSSSGVAVNNVFEMASIIYGSVSGEIRHEGEIIENNIPGFVVSPPVTVDATISNKGNVHEDATIILKVTDFFTGNVILSNEGEDEEEGQYNEIIMPDTERFITREISNLPAVGVVRVEQTIYYLGNSSNLEKTVIICPIWFLLLILVTICAIVAAIVGIVVKHKRKKRLV